MNRLYERVKLEQQFLQLHAKFGEDYYQLVRDAFERAEAIRQGNERRQAAKSKSSLKMG